jgi:alanine-synthesizing transaminase
MLPPLPFSTRADVDLSENALSKALALARAGARPVLDLTESNPTRAAIPYDHRVVPSALASPGWLRYEPEPFGLPLAREAVARVLSAEGPPIDASRVVLTASTSEAYAFLFKLLADPGDEVLVPTPSYPLFEHLARLESVRAVPYRLEYDGSWRIDLASVDAARSRRTRAVVVVSPNNPTGSYLKRAELRALAGLGLPVLSDEVFAGYPLRSDPERARSAREADGAPLVFSLGGLSKLAALPQLKLAWLAVTGDGARVSAALARLEIIADAFLSVGGPVQHALPALLEGRATAEQAIARRLLRNLAALRALLPGSAVSVLDVEGGWYAPLRLPRTRSEDEWVLAFLEEDGVYVHPGHYFEFAEEAYVIVSLLTIEDAFDEGVRRIVARVRASA